jgi:ABC-type sugar transport system substrate-binding protein
VTKSVIVQTEAADSQQAGQILGKQMAAAFPGESPDAAIVFASAIYDYPALLKEVIAACSP